MTETTIFLIRHGESEWNAKGIIQGSSDIPGLSEKGRKQVEKLKQFLDKENIDIVCSSPLKRAKETSEIIFGIDKFRVADGLIERGFGEIEGKRWEDVENINPEIVKGYLINKNLKLVNGSETLEEAQERGFNELMMIINKHKGKRIAIITHGQIIMLLILKIMNKKIIDIMNSGFKFDNTSVTILKYSDESKEFVIEKMNDVEHLIES